MRFTPDILLRHAEVLVEKETRNTPSIIAAYLQGSLLYGSPLLGGAGDIDLVFIHAGPPIRERLIKKITPEIHFDIEHHDQILYRKPREVRLHPRLGPAIRDAKPLYDPRHFLDYTQAGARSNFHYPENIHARTSPLIEKSRQFWMERQISPPKDLLAEFPLYLDALYNAANAVALLTGPPLPPRRLGLIFPERCAAVNAPGLAVAFNHLLGAISLSRDQLESWLEEWDQAISELEKTVSPPPLLAEKKIYFQLGMKSVLDSSRPGDMLWPLISTWTETALQLPENSQGQITWKKALTALGFAGNDYLVRLEALDSFLELCERLISGNTT